MPKKTWFASSDLAGLPGLPSSREAVARKMARTNPRSRPRKGRGGGKEYHISSLPTDTQDALLRAAVDPAVPPPSVATLRSDLKDVSKLLTGLARNAQTNPEATRLREMRSSLIKAILLLNIELNGRHD